MTSVPLERLCVYTITVKGRILRTFRESVRLNSDTRDRMVRVGSRQKTNIKVVKDGRGGVSRHTRHQTFSRLQ